MKKIIPIVTVLGFSAMLTGCNANMQLKKENFTNYLRSFQEDVNDFTRLNEKDAIQTSFNKYKLTLKNEMLNYPDKIIDTTELESIDVNDEVNALENNEIDKNSEKISTLYSLSNDIQDSCNEFCKLKEQITNAIIETENLMTQIKENKVELTREQRMFITEQSMQLKNLGKQLSNITTELSFNLSDLNQIMTMNNQNIDNLSLKYLVVLDNLVNGNEMLQSGINTLGLINQMFNLPNGMPSNNPSRILYGFQQNNNPMVFKDYYIDENGELTENSQEKTEENADNQTESIIVEEKSNVDTYSNTNLKSNIDTYQNTNVPRNIDTFFNTALLDNEFMYGNGYNGYYGSHPMNNRMYSYNPNMQNYAYYERNNTNNSTNTNENTQHIENKENKKEEKKIKFKKNIDTYQDENEPHISVKIQNIKNSISGFFNKFKKPEIENPVYRFNEKEE